MNSTENSKVWIYQSDRVLNANEEKQIQQILDNFTASWLAHGHQLDAKAEIRYNQFIILSVNEQVAQASGCSISKSVELLQEIEKQFHINLFDRYLIAYRDAESIETCNREEFEKLIETGQVNGETIVFNNMVTNSNELNKNWEVPMKNSWHARVFQLDRV
jgi:hypothetical protein